MHQKADIIAPLCAAGLGLTVDALTQIDTDAYGTFTGEIPRTASQSETAVHKARAALPLGYTVALASEGSFYPHPDIPLLTVNTEVVVLVQAENGIVIEGWATSLETMARRQAVATVTAAEQFLAAVGYPAQGVIVRMGSSSDVQIEKELLSADMLLCAVSDSLMRGVPITLETDLRAHRNPLRRQVIAAATTDLIAAAQRCCPVCATPGVRVVESVRGLRCAGCGLPTDRVRAVVHGCLRCAYREEQPAHHGDVLADPGQCGFCNP